MSTINNFSKTATSYLRHLTLPQRLDRMRLPVRYDVRVIHTRKLECEVEYGTQRATERLPG